MRVVSLCVCPDCPDGTAALDRPVFADDEVVADPRPSLILMPLVDLLCRCVDVCLSRVVDDDHVCFRPFRQFPEIQIRLLDVDSFHVLLLSRFRRMADVIC